MTVTEIERRLAELQARRQWPPTAATACAKTCPPRLTLRTAASARPVLLSVHEYVGGYLQALEQQLQQQGKEPEQARRQAREMAILHFRATAQMWAGFSQQAVARRVSTASGNVCPARRGHGTHADLHRALPLTPARHRR